MTRELLTALESNAECGRMNTDTSSVAADAATPSPQGEGNSELRTPNSELAARARAATAPLPG